MALFMTGCAHQVEITFNSDPYGATIYTDNGHSIGYAPKTLYYNIPENTKESKIIRIAPISARWASGATSDSGPILVDINRHGLKQEYTFKRPSNTPGADIDAKFAIELRRQHLQAAAVGLLLLQQQQAQQEQQQNYELEKKRIQAENERALIQQNRSINCSTTYNYGGANTTCY